MKRLGGLREIAPTSERLCLLGASYKALAVLSLGAEVRANLEKSLESYAAAHQHNVEAGTVEAYPIINWLALAAVLGREVPDGDALLHKAETSARERFSGARDYFDAPFDAVAIADVALVRALRDRAFAADTTERAALIDRIVTTYREVFERTFATPRQIDAATSQLSTIGELLQAVAPQPTPPDTALVVDALSRIRQRVRAEADERDAHGATVQPVASQDEAAATTTRRGVKRKPPAKRAAGPKRAAPRRRTPR